MDFFFPAWHVSFIRVPWLIHMCVTTYSYVRHDSFIRFTRSFCECAFASWTSKSYARREVFMWVALLIHSHERFDPLSKNLLPNSVFWRLAITCVPHNSLIYVLDVTHSCVWHDSFMCVTWLIHVCDMTHSNVWHDSLMCLTWLIHVCDMTQLVVLELNE